MQMTKRNWLIVLIAVFMALSVITLLLIFLLPKKDEEEFTLTLTCQNLTLDVNTYSKLIYSINSPLAKVEMKIEDESIAKIDEEGFVLALKPGTTQISVTASLGEDTVTKTAQIIVLSPPITFKLISNFNCESDGLTLLCKENAIFSFEVYDKNEEIIIDPNFSTMTSEGISYTRKFSNFLLTSKCDGFITFNFYELGETITIKIIYSP